MTFINWSDSEEMLGLLCEYVADEKNESQDDRERLRFLAELSADLADLAGDAPGMPADAIIERLRATHASRADDFAGDPVLMHVEACIEELERIRSQSNA
ncbi:MAG: hypothetical protein ACXVJT_06515 [Thermoanaerobaculia bacterium]